MLHDIHKSTAFLSQHVHAIIYMCISLGKGIRIMWSCICTTLKMLLSKRNFKQTSGNMLIIVFSAVLNASLFDAPRFCDPASGGFCKENGFAACMLVTVL